MNTLFVIAIILWIPVTIHMVGEAAGLWSKGRRHTASWLNVITSLLGMGLLVAILFGSDWLKAVGMVLAFGSMAVQSFRYPEWYMKASGLFFGLVTLVVAGLIIYTIV